MNKRIEKLIEQATEYFPKTETSGEYSKFDEEKFALLIIQKCIRLCDQVDYVGADECMDNIKDYFGVK